MNSLLHLSNVASQVERLREPSSSAPSSSSSSPQYKHQQEQQQERQNSRDALTVPFVTRDQERERSKSSEQIQPSDRKAIKDKIKLAFRKKSTTFDELLDLCSQFAEQKVYDSAPTKLDYYKTGIQCCKNVIEVGDALAVSNSVNAAMSSGAAAAATPGDGKAQGLDGEKPEEGDDSLKSGTLKRAKTQH